MNLFRAKNPQVIDYLKDMLMSDGDTTKEEFAELFREFMTTNPDECFVLTLWDDSEIKGFMMCYIPYKRQHLFIAQAHIDKTLANTDWTRIAFSHVLAFAENNGLTEIRAETQRSPEAFLRRWGFENYSTTLSYKTFNTDNVEVDKNGNNTRRWTEQGVNIDVESTKVGESPGPSSDTGA